MITAAIHHSPDKAFERTLRHFVGEPLVEKVVVVGGGRLPFSSPKCERVKGESFLAGRVLNALLERVRTGYLLLLFTQGGEIRPGPGAIERLRVVAETTGAGVVYPDYWEERKAGRLDESLHRSAHPLNDYQEGSIRDDFDFGCLMLFSMRACREALKKLGPIPLVKRAGLYDLRLKVSVGHELFHLREPLYTLVAPVTGAGRETLFDYVDPRNREIQEEMEAAATRHLKNVGAWLRPRFMDVPRCKEDFPVCASVVIPVRNRVRTVAEAVESALSQETDFSFNVIVVDNHSTDGTTRVLSGLARRHSILKHLVPGRTDLSIGGCWNQAVYSEHCGRYAVQLDSDDLYSGPHTLQKVVGMFQGGDYAMVIGSYTLVDAGLNVMPPGLVDHREWTERNGRNNALRINGLGAPRAFDTALLRRVGGFLNVGYGEDYEMALRLSRRYRIGRIYESLYLCRRWEGNTDAAPSIEERTRNDAFKDQVRTLEMRARRRMNGSE